MKHFLLCIFLYLIPILSFSEGIKELRPDSTVSEADLFFYNIPSLYPIFGLMNCPANYRLYIHVKSPGEAILFGLQSSYTYHTYNLRKPNGTIAMSGTFPYSTFQTGYIHYYHQAMKGPFPSAGGYTPLVYQVTSISDTGDYYFEISNLGSGGEDDIKLWDFQVVSGLHSPALPSDTINGRVWSKSWQFQAVLGAYRTFNARFFVCSDDGIVTKLKFTNGRVGAITIFCNPTGCYNTGNPLSDRKSVATNTYATFPGIAQYKVFLNNPDTSVYRTGVFGMITGTPYLIPDPAFPPCSAEKQVVVEVNKAGSVQIKLTFPYGAPATSVSLQSAVIAGINLIPWNGKDGQGNTVMDGTLINIQEIYMNGLTNLPIWDQEQNPGGYEISLVRPFNPVSQIPKVFWDDTNITEGGCPNGSDLSGCMPFPTGCHAWSGYDCHDKMINTWWYGNSDTATNAVLFSGLLAPAIGHDSTRCGPGSVLLHATVPPNETVDWYDTISGGTPLLIGDTSFNTPYITINTTYYAQARGDSSACTAAARTPVIAFIKPVPFPHLAGPGEVCDSSEGNLYMTDPNMLNYTWSISPGNYISGGSGTNQILVTWMVPGIQQVYVNYSDTGGCMGERPKRLLVMVTPKPDSAGPVSGQQVICAGTNGLIYSIPQVQYATSYTWILPPGAVFDSGAGTGLITVNFPLDAQSGVFTVYASDSCGDGVPAYYPVIVNHPPTASAGPDDTICQDSPYQVVGATASRYNSLSWTTNGQGSLLDDTTLTPVYTPSPGESGPVILTLIAYGRIPCGNDTSRLNLMITPSPIVSAGPDLSVCEGRSIQVRGSTASNYESLSWSTSGTGHFSDTLALNPVYFPGSMDSINGYAILTLHAMPFNRCLAASDSLKLSIQKGPSVTAGPGEISCESFPVILAGASASDYDSLRWTSTGAGTLSGDRTLTPAYQPAPGETGNIVLTLKAYGKAACSDTLAIAQTWLRIYPPVLANAGHDCFIPYGSRDTLAGSVMGGSGTFHYIWEPAALVVDSTSPTTVTESLEADTLFILTVVDDLSGCISVDTVRINILDKPLTEIGCVKVYNVITPNGDGDNDTWIIDCIEYYPLNKVEIFNAWGDIVRTFTNYNNSPRVWDGTNNEGHHLPDGTYYYVISIKDLKPFAGWVFLRGGWK